MNSMFKIKSIRVCYFFIATINSLITLKQKNKKNNKKTTTQMSKNMQINECNWCVFNGT